jgi:hypothetical protein
MSVSESLLRPLSVALVIALLPGCASIIHGSSQEIALQSNPSGAAVAVNGVRNAQTPATLSLPRKSAHSLEVTLDGYRPFQIQLQRSTSGWVWGNIAFGGLIGLVVDASTGSMYKLTPDQISAQLQATGSVASLEDDRVYLFVTLSADPDWEMVGKMEQE